MGEGESCACSAARWTWTDTSMADTDGALMERDDKRGPRVRLQRDAPWYRLKSTVELRSAYVPDTVKPFLLLRSYMVMRMELGPDTVRWQSDVPMWLPHCLRAVHRFRSSLPKRVLAARLRAFRERVERSMPDTIVAMRVALQTKE